jgi:hypothetical protein
MGREEVLVLVSMIHEAQDIRNVPNCKFIPSLSRNHLTPLLLFLLHALKTSYTPPP